MKVILVGVFAWLLGVGMGQAFQSSRDHKEIVAAHTNEAIANGLEDVCQQILKGKQ